MGTWTHWTLIVVIGILPYQPWVRMCTSKNQKNHVACNSFEVALAWNPMTPPANYFKIDCRDFTWKSFVENLFWDWLKQNCTQQYDVRTTCMGPFLQGAVAFVHGIAISKQGCSNYAYSQAYVSILTRPTRMYRECVVWCNLTGVLMRDKHLLLTNKACKA